MLKLVQDYNNPDSDLYLSSEQVEEIDNETRAFIRDMHKTIFNCNKIYPDETIGLTAPQVGLNLQIIVININKDQAEKFNHSCNDHCRYLKDLYPEYRECFKFALINPKIISYSREKVAIIEGCLSIPGKVGCIKRSYAVTVEYQDENGECKIINAKGLLAYCIQHEMDHLDGKLYKDRTINEKLYNKSFDGFTYDDDKKEIRITQLLSDVNKSFKVDSVEQVRQITTHNKI